MGRKAIAPLNRTGFTNRRTGHGDYDLFVLPPRSPTSIYRHAAPSGPWPWMDFDSDTTFVRPLRTESPVDTTWRGYPYNLFRNWTSDQVRRSKIVSGCAQLDSCCIHKVDVLSDGKIDDGLEDQVYSVSRETVDKYWESLLESRPSHVRVRALFLDSLTLPVLQMLGTKYNIEPFFFSSSINWIPSRYQDEMCPGEGDHLTITLPFISLMQNVTNLVSPNSVKSISAKPPPPFTDIQASLFLQSSNNILVQDLLSIHMVRTPASSTIISYHPSSSSQRTSAKRLRSLVQRAGQNLYWQRVFSKSNDPTFLLLAILWYVLYSWDEAFEALYNHTNWLESRVLSTTDIGLTSELHNVRAHLLHYQSLLQDFRRSISFIKRTPNPAMDVISHSERKESADLLAKECGNLIYEIDRLESRRFVQSSRLKNVIDFAFAIVNIEDSRHTQRLAETTVKDSASMKQISYLTAIFLPASFVAGVFGMNVSEINPGTAESLIHYIEATIALTIFTAWLIVSLQSHSSVHKEGSGLWRRVLWPVFFVKDRIVGTLEKRKGDAAGGYVVPV
ncbi:cora-like Mg2+ transporter protein-domain-containing protein [Scleroderma citrinum]